MFIAEDVIKIKKKKINTNQYRSQKQVVKQNNGNKFIGYSIQGLVAKLKDAVIKFNG